MSTFPWTKEKDALLIRLHREGKSWAYISRQLGCAGHDTVIVRYHAITGYLVGDLNRWNDAKRQEEHDRVKHGMGSINHEA